MISIRLYSVKEAWQPQPGALSLASFVIDSPRLRLMNVLDTSHNTLTFFKQHSGGGTRKARRSLVLGELGLSSAVQKNRRKGGMYPQARFFSVYEGCSYGCHYCYLHDSPGRSFSSPVKIYLNLPEIVGEIDRQAREAKGPIEFYLGKYQDGLALDYLTAYSTVLVPFFAEHPYARQVVQTKSANVERLLELEHKGRTTLSWTLSPETIAQRYEPGSPPTAQRIEAMKRCSDAGYPVSVNLAPVIPEGQWQRAYLALAKEILASLPIRRLFIGGICLGKQG